MIDHHLQELRSTDPARIEAAILSLGDLGDPKAVAPLVRSLHRFDDQPDLKALLCDVLGELGDLRATQALLSQLRDPHDQVRESAFTALFAIGEQRAHAMPDASSWEQGFVDPSAALTQIAWQTDTEAVQLLIRALSDDDQQVKIGALYTLGQLGFVGAFEQIRQALYDVSDEVSAAAAYALGELARLSAPSTMRDVIEALYQGWRRDTAGWPPLGVNAKIQVLRAAAERCAALSSTASSAQLAELFVAALGDPEHVLRQLAVIGLGRLRDPRALSLLEGRLHDSEFGVRRNAAYALGNLRAPESARVIVTAAVDQPSEVRVAMGWSLRRLSKEVSLQAIGERLTDPSSAQRVACARLLGELGESYGLERLLSDDDPEVRKSAALAVSSAEAHQFTPLLVKALSDDSWRVRTAVAESLKRLEEVNAIDSLERALSHERHSVARNALNVALSHLKRVKMTHGS